MSFKKQSIPLPLQKHQDSGLFRVISSTYNKTAAKSVKPVSFVKYRNFNLLRVKKRGMFWSLRLRGREKGGMLGIDLFPFSEMATFVEAPLGPVYHSIQSRGQPCPQGSVHQKSFGNANSYTSDEHVLLVVWAALTFRGVLSPGQRSLHDYT